MKKDQSSYDDLVRDFSKAPDNAGDLAEQLLSAFWDGYPVRMLVPLLKSDNQTVAFWASWVLSELGERGKDVLETTIELLGHPHEDVRSDAIQSLLACSHHVTAGGVGHLLSRYDAETPRVREEIIIYMSRAPLSLIRQGVESMPPGAMRERHLQGYSLLSEMSSAKEAGLMAALVDEDELVRAYAFASSERMSLLAARMLSVAAKSKDAVVCRLATAWLKVRNARLAK